jgi:hypothetical protein
MMQMQLDDKSFIVNSKDAITDLGKWIRTKFAEHPYLVISANDGLTRTQEQNKKLWPMLTDISKQVIWFGKKYSNEDWKDIITGSFRKAEFVPNLDGTGFILLGMRTSRMGRKEFAALIEYIYALGADKGVVWSEKSEAVYQEFKQAA